MSAEPEKFTIEMAFDWDIEPEPGQSNRLLENTLMHMNNGKFGQAGSYARLQTGQQILFPIYDNSEDNSSVGTVTDFKLQIVDAHTGETVVPFSSTPVFQGRKRMGTGGSSQIYGGGLPFFYPFGGGYFTLNRAGRYLVTMTLDVTKGNETRTFEVDPEWIVGSGGG